MKGLLLSVLLLMASCRSNAPDSDTQATLNVEEKRLEYDLVKDFGFTQEQARYWENIEDPANPKNPWAVKGEEGSSCDPNAAQTGCNEGFHCTSLRGMPPSCYRKCTERLSECKEYKGPGQSYCVMENGGDMRGGIPEGMLLCVVRCGGHPVDPACSPPKEMSDLLDRFGGPSPRALVRKCTGECPGTWKCGRTLEVDGPLRCG